MLCTVRSAMVCVMVFVCDGVCVCGGGSLRHLELAPFNFFKFFFGVKVGQMELATLICAIYLIHLCIACIACICRGFEVRHCYIWNLRL